MYEAMFRQDGKYRTYDDLLSFVKTDYFVETGIGDKSSAMKASHIANFCSQKYTKSFSNTFQNKHKSTIEFLK